MDIPAGSGEVQPRAELDLVVARFLNPEQSSSLLLIEGEPGIGKSTAWGVAVERAWSGGITVLACRGAESEVGLAFCGLGDLLDDHFDALSGVLPSQSVTTLEAALLRASRPSEERSEREVGLAVTAALRELSAGRDLLIAIDDAQWVDRPTVEALCFALRRLGAARLRLLIASRLGEDGSRPDRVDRLLRAARADHRHSVVLAGFPAPALARIVHSRLGLKLTSRTAHDLADRVNGNPFWALEMAGAAAEPGQLPPEPSVSASQAELLHRRFSALPPDVRTALATVAALSRPSVDKAVAALHGFVDDPEAAVDAAVESGVVTEAAGMLRPIHPLLGSAALQLTPPLRRRRLHLRFAELASDPEQRAAHLALAAGDQPDVEVAAALDAGIEHARRRGAVQVAADLADRAVACTPVDDLVTLNRRRLTAAALNFSTGDLPAACAQVEQVWADREHCPDWAQMLALLVELTYWVHGRQAAEAIVDKVLTSYPDDHPRRLQALALGADVGDGRGTPRTQLAEQAIALADRLVDPDPWAVGTALLYLVSAKLDAGQGIDRVSMQRARQAEDDLQRRRPHWTPVLNRVDSNYAYFLKIVDDLSGSRRELLRCIDTATREGDDGSLAALFGHLALTECWAGDYPAALAAAERGTEQAGFGGGVVPVVMHAAQALTLVHTGDIEAANRIVAAQLPDLEHPQNGVRGVVLLHVAGVADLLTGDVDSAATTLNRAYELAVGLGIVEPGRRQRLEGDLGEALAATGRWDQLESLAAEQLKLGAGLDRLWVRGVGQRLSALHRAGVGDLDSAAEFAQEAVQAHQKSAFPLDLARSRLVLARILRRQRARHRAEQETDMAIGMLTSMGAKGWLARVSREHETPPPRRASDSLTATERRVAELVAAGHTNKEVASRLFVSVRTVEGHLVLIYRKLGVRSRTELAQHGEVNSAPNPAPETTVRGAAGDRPPSRNLG